MNAGPNWQWPQKPTAHFIFRSRDKKILSSATPRCCSALTVNRIMISGPHNSAMVLLDLKSTRDNSVVTTPTLPRQSTDALSTVTSTSKSKRLRQRLSSFKYKRSFGVRAP